MKKFKNIIVLALATLAFVACVEDEKEEKNVSIYLAGDSTMQSYNPNKTLMWGWGQALPYYLDSTITVHNNAKAGRSTKSFLAEGRWDTIMAHIQPDDYVIIQFGHNDASNKPERHAAYPQYKENMLHMINQAIDSGARPILATSIVMRTWEGRALVDDRLLGYPAITRQLADSLNLPLIDVYVQFRDKVIMKGPEDSKEFYLHIGPGVDKTYPDGREDDTHMCETGARVVAEIVAKEIKKQNLKDIANHVVIP